MSFRVTNHYKVIRVCMVLPLCLFTFLPLSSQTFTKRLQQKGKATDGTVTVSHDKAIDDLVNGSNAVAGVSSVASSPSASASDKKPDDKPVAQKSESQKIREQLKAILEDDSDTSIVTMPDMRKKVMRGGVKVDGYRVQAFAGGNQRKDRQKAEHVGSTIKQNYPDEPIYVHFYSPRWICRVGNYRTYEEAHQMLLNIRKLGISGASIVKGKITVPSY